MEGDGPKLAMVLYEYVRVIDNLEKQQEKASVTLSPLEPMFDPMLDITRKDLTHALNCNTVIMATFLHPAWRMQLFSKMFQPHVKRIKKLVQTFFDDRKALLKSLEPEEDSPKQSQCTNGDPSEDNSDSDSGEFNFYPQVNKSAEVDQNTELDRYNRGDFPMDKKGDLLGWWKVSPFQSYSLDSIYFLTHSASP